MPLVSFLCFAFDSLSLILLSPMFPLLSDSASVHCSYASSHYLSVFESDPCSFASDFSLETYPIILPLNTQHLILPLDMYPLILPQNMYPLILPQNMYPFILPQDTYSPILPLYTYRLILIYSLLFSSIFIKVYESNCQALDNWYWVLNFSSISLFQKKFQYTLL